MEVPMYLNVKVIGCGLVGGTLAAMIPIAFACGWIMGGV